MEGWKRAFKIINGKTPTKKDCELASSALKEPVKSTKRTLFGSPKKVGSLLKRPPSNIYVSPAKKRKLLDRVSGTLEYPNENFEPVRKSPRKTAVSPLKETNIFSPLKGWSEYQGTPQKTPQKSVTFALDPRSPSPKKRTPNSACRNIGFLLDIKTPEKKEIKEEVPEEVLFPEFADEKPDAPRITDSSKPKKKSDKNFIKLNMRKKTFVRGKKKNFKKFKKFKKWKK
ncbi:hypothetical protein FO519_001877 [Halicephalobus sp. NKZ332]|nr:hypothetical protein FO519_001877 [Halicephalobus sp. NKZ332]